MRTTVTSPPPAGRPRSAGRWRSLVADIAELEELLADLRDQHDALSNMNRRRLEALLAARRRQLREADAGGLVA